MRNHLNLLNFVFSQTYICFFLLLSPNVAANGWSVSEANPYQIDYSNPIRKGIRPNSQDTVTPRLLDDGDYIPINRSILNELNVNLALTPESTDIIGDAIDLNTGAVSFNQIDISIPGNFPISVAVQRRYYDANFTHRNTAEFGDWGLAIPAIHNTLFYSGGKLQNFWGVGKECSTSTQQKPSPYMFRGDLIEATQFWGGVSIKNVASDEKLIAAVNSGADQIYTTKSNWKVSCYQRVDGSGEGFKATTPQGITYFFDVPHMVRAQLPDYPQAPLYQVFLRASKITDRYGNSVQFTYQKRQTQSGIVSNNLVSITASDGRSITLKYEHPTEAYLVTSVVANQQTWRYQYQGQHIFSLDKVVLPDQTYWQYGLASISGTETDSSDFPDAAYGACQLTGTRQSSGNIRHPRGLVAEFILNNVLHGRTNTPNLKFGGNSTGQYRTARCFQTMALVQKSLTGPGVNQIWKYQYSSNLGAYSGQPKQEIPFKVDGYDSGDLKTTTVTAPDGSKTQHVFYRAWDYLDGTEVATRYLDVDGSTLLKSSKQLFESSAALGTTELSEINTASLIKRAQLTATDITTFTQGYVADTFSTLLRDYNSFGVATKTIENNSLGVPERTTVRTFQHDLKNWLLNLETNRQITEGAVSVSEYSAVYFNPTDAERSALKRERRYGIPYRDYTYHPDGTVASITYTTGNRWIAYSNYKRGKPQNIALPNRYDAGSFRIDLQQINDSGTIAWASDLNGNKTSYSYDSLNRLTLIDPADPLWDDTIIKYESDPTGKGSLNQLVHRGNYSQIVTLDALLQPVLNKEWDTTNEAETSRYVNQQFNAYGKPTFTSVVSDQRDESFGTSYSYDGLQRILSKTNTTQGDLTYRYEANNSILVENGRGFKTTTRYLAYGQPQTDLVTKILQPEGVATSIEYNIAGLPTAITQGGLTEIRRYDEYMRFCIVKRPDIGMKLMERNTAGQITRFAEGVNGNGSHCRDYTTKDTNWVGFAYDNFGDLHFTAFGDKTTPTTTRQLDRQGNVKKISAGNVIWDYNYNSLGLPTTETLQAGSKNYLVSNSYNRLGHLKSQQYGGATVEYAPTALGLPTKAADTQAYATQVQYHPGGNLKSFLYGNGLKFSQFLNAEFQPYERKVQKGTMIQLGQRYSYDDTNNLAAILDLVKSNQSIHMSYDGLDRLDTAAGIWGIGNFDYDELGNLQRKQLGTQDLLYHYDSNKKLQTVTGGYSFSYDDRGNIINNGKRSFSFNRANQLTNAPSLSYSYDGYGRRVIKTTISGTVYSLYNQAGKLLLTDGPNGIVRYIYLGNELIAKSGATLAVVDKPGYTGHIEDRDLDLTYMQQRYYDPVIGRFYSNDPVGFTASNPMMFNRYSYGNNNPYKFTDPTGETAEAVVLSRERGKVFVYPPSSHAHASKRHAQGYQGLGKGSPQQFMSKFGMQDYKMSATVVGAVVESGAEYYQEGTGTTVYTFETGQQIGELGETALSVATTPLSSLKDPAKIAEVTTMMTEAGVSQDQYGNVEVVTTIAPDNGTFKRDDAILMKKQE